MNLPAFMGCNLLTFMLNIILKLAALTATVGMMCSTFEGPSQSCSPSFHSQPESGKSKQLCQEMQCHLLLPVWA